MFYVAKTLIPNLRKFHLKLVFEIEKHQPGNKKPNRLKAG